MGALSTLVVVTNRARGGAQMIAANFARYFARNNRLSAFLTLAKSPSDVPDGIRSRSLLGFLGRPLFFILAIPALILELRRTKPQVVFSTLLVCNVLVVLAARLALGKSVTVVLRETTMIGARFRTESIFKKLVLRAARIVYPMADAILAPSQGVAEDLRTNLGIAADKIRHLPNPTITSDFEARMAETIDHPFYGSGAGPIYVACGRLGPEKGYDVLIRAFVALRTELPAARLLILGEGAERPSLEALLRNLGATDVVDLPGFRENPLPYIRRADVFVLSSLWEGLPNALIQALGCGTTPVATDCRSGPREILLDGALGHLVPVGDVDGLRRAMSAAFRKPIEPRLLQDRARNFSEEAVFARYDAMVAGLRRRQPCR